MCLIMKILYWLALFSLCTLLPAGEFQDFQEHFEAQLAELDEKKLNAINSWERWYLRSLLDLREPYTQKGDLDGVLALRTESERFLEERILPDPFSELEALNTLQREAAKRLERITEVELGEIRRLAGSYDLALAELQKKLTREGKIDEALAVRAERERLLAEYQFGSEQAAGEAVAQTQPQANESQAPIIPGGLRITKARYGANNKFVDVTKEVQKAIREGKLSIRASNSIKGDPTPGVVKDLIVEYQYRSRPGSRSVREGQMLELP